MRKIAYFVGVILFLVAMIIPVLALIWISSIEQKQYTVENDIRIGEIAYGDICEANRIDLEETVTVSGTVVSGKVDFIELSEYYEPYKLRFIIHEGDCVAKGQLIAYYKGNEVYADKDGIVEAISIGDESYIMLDSLSDLTIKVDCSDDNTFKKLNQKNLKLQDDFGCNYSIAKIDNAKNENGQRYAYVRSDDSSKLTYGDKLENIRLYTGKTYKDVLAVYKNCVYSYNDDKTYVRVIDDSGAEEVEVQVGFYTGDFAVISGIEEGTKCDSGYKSLLSDEDSKNE